MGRFNCLYMCWIVIYSMQYIAARFRLYEREPTVENNTNMQSPHVIREPENVVNNVVLNNYCTSTQTVLQDYQYYGLGSASSILRRSS
jgi:hypothetical protein